MRPQMDCVCMDEQCRSDRFDISEISADRGQDMSSRIDLYRCIQCERFWLRYTVVDEASGAWGKWYRGLITPDAAQDITPERARNLLASLSWHFYGGSYYRSAGDYTSGAVPIGPPSCMAWAA